jgi:hypothetical protein
MNELHLLKIDYESGTDKSIKYLWKIHQRTRPW